MADLPVTERLVIPARDLSVSYSRSGGPGGQHVNTTETRVQLRFDLEGCAVLFPVVKERVRKAAGNKLTSDGAVLITADRHRSRHMNVEDARSRLADLVRGCLKAPKKRKATKPTKGSRERRLAGKKKRSQTKAGRGRVKHD